MKKFYKVLSVCLAALLLAGCLSACGGGKNKAQAKVIDIELTEEQYAFGVDKDQPELLAQINDFVKEIRSNGQLEEIFAKYFEDGTPTPVASAKPEAGQKQLVVATNAAFPPFEYTEGDKFLGIDMELAALLAEKLGRALVIQHMDFAAVCIAVEQHKCDVGMAALTVTPDREKSVTFSESYYSASQKLIVPADDAKFDACKTKEDVDNILRGLDSGTKIGFQTGTTGQSYTESTGDYEANGFKVTAVGYDNAALAVQDMLNGNLDYVITDAAPADAIVKSINAAA